MNGLTPEEKSSALQYAYGGADFMFMPSAELCNMLISNSSQTQGINYVLVTILLERKPVRLDPNTVIKYCQGTLDRNNTWLFDNGHIKVVPPRFKKPVSLKPKDDDMKNKSKIEQKDGKLIIEDNIKKEENSNGK